MPDNAGKPEGWFSRRHATRAPHDEAVAKYKAESARHRAKAARRAARSSKK